MTDNDRSWPWWYYIVVATFTVITVLLIAYREGTPARGAPNIPAPTQIVAHPTPSPTSEVQSVLRGYGYSIAVDGEYGPQTTKAVRHWQQVNGLYVDGIAGPITRGSLGLSAATRGTQTNPPGSNLTPIDGDCDSWRPLFTKYGLPWDVFLPVMQRESRCTNAHANDHDDHSHGPIQVNRLNAAWAWDGLGFTHDYMHTPEGAVHAAGALYKRCGMGPWIRQYNCGFPNGAVSRWDWPA